MGVWNRRAQFWQTPWARASSFALRSWNPSGGRLPCRIDIHIRKAEPKDAPIIAEFNLLLASETENLQLERDRLLSGVAALLGDPAKGVYYVAEIGGEVAGQVMITYEWSDWRNGNLWWLQSVYVRKTFRGQGVFRALFGHVERLAREQDGVEAIRLYMHVHNHGARRSYEALGMCQTNYIVFELGLSD